jgi:hypothetical protein
VIPRIIHQLWIGPRPLPKFTASWQRYADLYRWEYRLWREKEIDELNLKWRECYDATDSLHIRSDIARIEILSRFGGFYFDCDVISSGAALDALIPIDHVRFVGVTEHNPNVRFAEEYRKLLPFHYDSTWNSLFIHSGWVGAAINSRTIARAQQDMGESFKTCGPEIAASGFGPNVLNASICEPIFLLPNCFTSSEPTPTFPHLSCVARYEA